MAKHLKVIWDFRGPAAEQTAIHYEKHLQEYCAMNNMPHHGSGVQHPSGVHSMAYLVIDPVQVEKIKLDLKPQRGEWLETE